MRTFLFVDMDAILVVSERCSRCKAILILLFFPFFLALRFSFQIQTVYSILIASHFGPGSSTFYLITQSQIVSFINLFGNGATQCQTISVYLPRTTYRNDRLFQNFLQFLVFIEQTQMARPRNPLPAGTFIKPTPTSNSLPFLTLSRLATHINILLYLSYIRQRNEK